MAAGCKQSKLMRLDRNHQPIYLIVYPAGVEPSLFRIPLFIITLAVRLSHLVPVDILS